ncbi:ABC transporter permease [Falsiroseomonas ponticola]|uniref:ABC transporter permease n=1 Tax=Falsiroseomonas ponticola TaxID=2786951 RepID=UPI001931946A|nr:ABC transporter permease [Roseomonas ponticola]
MHASARRGLIAAGLLAPAALVFALLFIWPQLGLFLQSMPPGAPLAQYERFLGDSYYLGVLGNSLLLGLCVTLVTLVLGFPLAFLLARAETRWAGLLLLLTSFPLWVSAVVRSFAWMVLFFRNGVASRLLQSTGLVESNFQLIGTFAGVVIALAQVLLPIMIVTLYAVIRGIDRDLEHAAMSLGASPIVALWLVTIRLARGGILAGSLLVFSLSVSAFATPSLVGGARAHFMAVTIYEQTLELLDWPFAAAIAAILLAISISVALTYGRLLGDAKEQAR